MTLVDIVSAEAMVSQPAFVWQQGVPSQAVNRVKLGKKQMKTAVDLNASIKVSTHHSKKYSTT